MCFLTLIKFTLTYMAEGYRRLFEYYRKGTRLKKGWENWTKI